MEINYRIVPVHCKDGKTVWKLYENHNLIQTFPTYCKAVEYRDYYKRMMR